MSKIVPSDANNLPTPPPVSEEHDAPKATGEAPERVDLEAGRGDRFAWLISLGIHGAFLIVISLITTHVSRDFPALVLTSPPDDAPQIKDLLPDEFHFDPSPRDEIGGSSVGGLSDDELSAQLVMPESTQIPTLDLEPQDSGHVEVREMLEVTTGPQAELNLAIKGTAGVGVTGAEGAIDYLTQEILLSLEERKTLVVWFFDRSASLQTQRETVKQRFARVYEELGVIEASGDEAFARHADKPLLTAVVAFGQQVEFVVEDPTDDLDEIQSAIDQLEVDDSGVEHVFTAFTAATARYRKYRTAGDRNIMFVAFTDEAGNDQQGLDRTVDQCRRLAIPVYVIGVPAPFGRRETLVKWVDPDPRFDQSPQWGRVDQGPESLLPERIKLQFGSDDDREAPLDSGFGPFALTRLCYETGGIYFTVHPNRVLSRRVSRRETEEYSAHFVQFFDPDIMRRYRPDYVSAAEYRAQLRENRSREALIRAAELSWIATLEPPRRRFVVRNEAAFVGELTEAQKAAARLAPAFEQLYQTLKVGEADREREIVPRWQAGYDLAMGRVLASKVRAEGYNTMLAKAKRGLKFSDDQNNTWQLDASTEVSSGSRLEREAASATDYLQRVVQDHPGTPWAAVAQRELQVPLGWTWKEDYTETRPPQDRQASNNNNPNPAPQDDQVRMLRPQPKRRPPPKL